eukprot:TRINITY_DN4127_c0_g1_i1.p1 TRINITY_DN4127_c0_g1~~TRINITY_DN4127_c0_g1_i1.p1  ORF type:complete len:347 (-),score=52.42 TRINITY_DN4127_c0_g1_i1:145-1098(-)
MALRSKLQWQARQGGTPRALFKAMVVTVGIAFSVSSWWLPSARNATFVRSSPSLLHRHQKPSTVVAVAQGDTFEILADEDGRTFERFHPTPSQEMGMYSRGKRGDRRKENPWDDSKWYVGTVKSYYHQQGYGFIICDEIRKTSGFDVFLTKIELQKGSKRSAFPGEQVRFKIGVNKDGKPQAREIQEYNEEVPWVDPNLSFMGKVSKYNSELGFGFIDCEETKSIFNSDVFLHRNQAEALKLVPGNIVTFTVEVTSKGRAQARNVKAVSVDGSREINEQDLLKVQEELKASDGASDGVTNSSVSFEAHLEDHPWSKS